MRKFFHFIQMVTAMTFIMSGLTLQAQNMLLNPGFEDWNVNGAGGPPDNWGLSGSGITAVQEAVQIHGGTYSVNITWTTTSTRWIEQVDIPVTAGNNYEFRFWALDNDAGGRARVAIRWYDTGGSFLSGFYGDYTADSPDWQQMTSGSQQAPVGAVTAHAEVRIYDVSGWPGTATVYVDDAEFLDVSGAIPVIVNAFTVSTTAVDVVYDNDITSVDPTDYTLTGSATISFANATIDGTDPKIVHLTGASSQMTGDITLDNIADDGLSTNFDFYAGIMPIAFAQATNPGGTMDDIHIATFQGIISADDEYNNVWIHDAAGQYNGIMIFGTGFPSQVNVGDEIILAAFRQEYNNFNELVNPSLISVLSSGNIPYGPDLIPGSAIDETIGANTNPAEPWEGQLVNIEDFTVESYTAYDYRCSWSDGSSTYYFHVGDNVNYQFAGISLIVGAQYESITGVVDWYWNGSYYRINPRTQDDIVQSYNPPVKLAVVSINGGINPLVSTPFDVVVQAQDAGGIPAIVTGDVNFTFTTNGGTLGNVGFVMGSTTAGTILDGTSEVTVTGVAMEPAGTGVTITASDNAMLLASGTSVPFDVVEPVIPDIIITEIMQNPDSVSDNDGEWFEVFNTTNAPIDMLGWIIRDDGTNADTVKTSLVVPAQGFAVLGINGDPGINGGYTCDYVYTNYFLGNSDDEVVILLPDGITEVDRVNYDGGPNWPDPTGASMVFTGTPANDNNDYNYWTTATLREPTYTGATGDLGSPGTNGHDQNLVTTAGITLDIKVFLEGPYDPLTHVMSTILQTSNYIPLSQPYNPPLPYYNNNNPGWLYAGTENVAAIPANVVDWVLVELRDAVDAASAISGTMIGRQAAFLLDNGTITGLDGTSMLNFNLNIVNNLFVVVWHRNHLNVLSASPLVESGGVYSYDFTTAAGQAFGGFLAHKEVESGVWGMIGGDGNGDLQANNSDKIEVWAIDAANSGYLGGDFSLDGQCNNQDKIEVWVPNSGSSSQVP